MATFLRNAPNGTADEALKLYIWDRKLAAAFLADLAILEIALREGLHRAATEKWGCIGMKRCPWITDRKKDWRKLGVGCLRTYGKIAVGVIFQVV